MRPRGSFEQQVTDGWRVLNETEYPRLLRAPLHRGRPRRRQRCRAGEVREGTSTMSGASRPSRRVAPRRRDARAPARPAAPRRGRETGRPAPCRRRGDRRHRRPGRPPRRAAPAAAAPACRRRRPPTTAGSRTARSRGSFSKQTPPRFGPTAGRFGPRDVRLRDV